MPAPEADLRLQTAVLWATEGGVDNYGRPTVGVPQEILVRWVEGKSESKGSQDSSQSYDASAVVDRVIRIGSTMWLGRLADLPAPPESIREVVDYRETPDIKNRNVRRVVRLMRRSDSLPQST